MGGTLRSQWKANRWLGFVADFSGHYFGQDVTLVVPPNPPVPATDNKRQHTFLFGPRFSYRNSSRFIPFAQALIGSVRLSEFVDPRLIPGVVSTRFGFALGGGVDFKLSERFALRPVQADYQYSHRSLGQDRHNFRYSGGIVFRFGKR